MSKWKDPYLVARSQRPDMRRYDRLHVYVFAVIVWRCRVLIAYLNSPRGL